MDVNVIITSIQNLIHQLERDQSIPSLIWNTLPLSIEEKGMKNKKLILLYTITIPTYKL